MLFKVIPRILTFRYQRANKNALFFAKQGGIATIATSNI